jgi:hypothetical protein
VRTKAEEEEQAAVGKAAKMTGDKTTAIAEEAAAAAAAAAAAHLQAKSEEVSQAFSLVLSLSSSPRPLSLILSFVHSLVCIMT